MRITALIQISALKLILKGNFKKNRSKTNHENPLGLTLFQKGKKEKLFFFFWRRDQFKTEISKCLV